MRYWAKKAAFLYVIYLESMDGLDPTPILINTHYTRSPQIKFTLPLTTKQDKAYIIPSGIRNKPLLRCSSGLSRIAKVHPWRK